MYDDTATAKCKCSVPYKCDMSAVQCDCAAYCPLYEGSVAFYARPYYITISPNPSNITTYKKLVDDYKQEILKKLIKVTKDYIVVLELAGIRPHFHCIFDVKDPVGFNIKLLNLSRYDNVKKHGPFKKGLHYLFKDVTKTYNETGIIPIIERADVVEYNDRLKKQKEEEDYNRKRQMGIEVDYPKWMTEGLEKDIYKIIV